MLKNWLAALGAMIFLSACSPEKTKADLILHHGVIYSVDSNFTVYQALAVKDGKILALGSDEAILSAYAAKEEKNLNGLFVFPGFIDAHCHFLNYGLGLEQADLTGTASFGEVLERVIAFTKKLPGDVSQAANPSTGKAWITGRGWDQNDWTKKEFPDKRQLDSLFPHIPVLLTRIDGHAALANQEALRLSGIDLRTKIEGGKIEVRNNKLTGILIDNAVDLVKSKIPQPPPDKLYRALMEAQQNCFKAGLTTVDDAGLMANEIEFIDQLQKKDELKIRVYAMLSDSASNYKTYLDKGLYKTERLNVRSFKFYADGALGSRGACLLRDYADQPGWKGFLLHTKAHFDTCAKLMIEKGFQMNTHCIGDSAYRLMLDIYKKAGATKAQRWRIEHAQVVDPADMKRSGDLIPSVQPTHATSDMYWAGIRLGAERLKNAYAYKALLNASGTMALGTDFPVEDISPLKTFYAAVARKDVKGFPDGGFQTENALTREQAMRGMTIWAAYSNFEELEKGSLEKGKFADLIVLDTDLMKCPLQQILKIKIIATYINGENVIP